MRIGFDVSQTAEPMAGCAIVADQFLRHLVQVCPDDVFIPYPVFGNYRHPDFARATRPDALSVDPAHFALPWETITSAWDRPGGRSSEFLGRPDVVHANNFWCPLDLDVPLVYTLYDLSQMDCPEFHTEQNRIVCFEGLLNASTRANHIVAISEHSRQRFLYWFPHVPPDRVTVVTLAARPSLTDAESRDNILTQTGLEPGGFWLAVGTIEPRKNYGLLLDVYARLIDDLPRPVRPLCIVGQAGWIESSLAPKIRRLGLESHVHCLGFLPDAELATLYRHCFGFVYPSLYEGFGLPIVEAMACGAAVIASRATSVPEVVGDAGVLVEGGTAQGYFTAMRRLSVDSGYRNDLRMAAVDRAQQFSWSRSAKRLREVYQRTVADN